jgi:hypothetical protein
MDHARGGSIANTLSDLTHYIIKYSLILVRGHESYKPLILPMEQGQSFIFFAKSCTDGDTLTIPVMLVPDSYLDLNRT